MKKTTKTNTKSKLSKEELDNLSKLSGEKDTKSAPAFKLSSLKLNGRDGGFFKTVLASDGSIKHNEDGKALLVEVKNPTGIILRPRKSFSKEGGDYQLFSTEGSVSPKSVFTIFKKTDGVKGPLINMVGQGTASELKTQFPEIKMNQILYFLLDTEDGHELVRLKVHGMGLCQIFNYFKEFDATEHIFQYKTILSQKADKNQFGKFFVPTFKKGEALTDFTAVKENLELINAKIEAIELYAKERSDEAEAMVEAKTTGKRSGSLSLDEIRESLKANKEWKKEEEEYNAKVKLPVIDADDDIDVSEMFK